MLTLPLLKVAIDNNPAQEYECQGNLNLYDSPDLRSLATQAMPGRQLKILALPFDEAGQVNGTVIQVRLCEDDYPGWIAVEDLDLLEAAEAAYEPLFLPEAETRARMSQVIAFTYSAMNQPNRYLWGGTVGPNYDCSGLMQTAFASVGIWIPRDAYQQEGFAQRIALQELEPGDLVFFGTPDRATHVGLYIGESCYLHSSGRDQGRNGIGIDTLAETEDRISRTYSQQLRGAGRILSSYQSTLSIGNLL
ncbi:C40 family peptidase [Leptolyngbya sp. ST-U4]